MTPTTTRWCKDINMWTIDRPINPVGDVEGSCVHRTSFCDTSCYNVKLYKMFKGMAKKDIANEKFWQSLPTNKNDNQDSLEALQQKLFRTPSKKNKCLKIVVGILCTLVTTSRLHLR